MMLLSAVPLDNTSTALIIWGICIGVILGFVYNYLSRMIVGPFVKALLAKDCIGQSNAISLRDAGFLGKKLLYFFLRDGSALRNTVSVVGGKLPTISQGNRVIKDYENARFYIPEVCKEKAAATFGQKDKWYFLVLFIVLAIGCAYGMTKVMPLLLESLF